MKRVKYLSIVIMLQVFIAGCGVNNIPTYDERVKASWAEVENQYQRRADLIPNLETVVKQAADYEQGTLVEVTKARASLNMLSKEALLDNKEMMEKYLALQNTIGTNMNFIMRQMERYPALQANQNFLRFSSQLEGTENRIAIARREFIKSVEQYNKELKTYPGKFFHAYIYGDYKLRADSVYYNKTSKRNNVPEVDFE